MGRLLHKIAKFLNKHDPKAFPAMLTLIEENRTLVTHGRRGSGKSCLMKSAEIAIHNDIESFQEYLDFIQRMKREKEWSHLTTPRTRVFENGSTVLSFPGERTVRSYFIRTDQYGLPDGKNDVALLPPYAVFFSDECQTTFSGSRMKTMPEYVEQGFMKDRHADRNSWLTTHRLSVLNAGIKELAEGVFWHNRRVVTFWFPVLRRGEDGKLHWKKQNFLSVWRGVYYSDYEDAIKKKKPVGLVWKPIVPLLQRLFSFGLGTLSDVVEYKKFRFWGDIFSHYNSKRYLPSYLRDLETKDFTLLDPIDDFQKLTPQYVRDFILQDMVFRKKTVEEKEKANKNKKQNVKVEI